MREQTPLIAEIVAAVEQLCAPRSQGWAQLLDARLNEILGEQFKEGEVLYADQLNQLVVRIRSLEEERTTRAQSAGVNLASRVTALEHAANSNTSRSHEPDPQLERRVAGIEDALRNVADLGMRLKQVEESVLQLKARAANPGSSGQSATTLQTGKGRGGQ